MRALLFRSICWIWGGSTGSWFCGGHRDDIYRDDQDLTGVECVGRFQLISFDNGIFS